jgi:hypothetical protein
MYAMIVVSNTGSVSVDSNHTDWPSREACEYAAQTLYQVPPSATINGARLQMKTNVQCVPVDPYRDPIYGSNVSVNRYPDPPPPPHAPYYPQRRY